MADVLHCEIQVITKCLTDRKLQLQNTEVTVELMEHLGDAE